MKTRKLKVLKKAVVFTGLLLPAIAFAQGFLRTDGKNIVNDHGSVLLRGIGLGGWVLQEPYMLELPGIARTQTQIRAKINSAVSGELTGKFYDTWIKNGVTKTDIDSLSSWGFNSLRLPMHYNLFTLPVEQETLTGENTWLEKGFTVIDSLLAWCKSNNMYLMLDLHAVPGGQGNDIAISDASEIKLWENDENKKKTIALWKKIAERYAREEWIGAYDILNEPNYGFQSNEDKNGCKEEGNEALRELMIEITTAIREVDNKHIIVISGNCWGTNYRGIFPLWDENMVISFHKYWNYNTVEEIDYMLEYREKYNAPLWLSESGENSNAWSNDAIRLIESHNIGWCWWTYKKMGLSCPMQVKPVPGYEKLKKYWKGEGEKLSEKEAWEILSQLAENYKIENTVYHKDYIDALFRQVKTGETIPFKPHVLNKRKKLTIFASDYDLGRSSRAYFDKDSANYRTSTNENTIWNKGLQYRNDGVDIICCDDDELSNGYCVGYIEAGEWIQYTVDVEKAGKYTFNSRIANQDAASFYFTVNNTKTNSVQLNQAGEKKWITRDLKNIALKKGENVIRMYAEQGGFDISNIQIE
ncbi:MAG: cellulase family glycosylhydrolase [Prevotellaceae bacterium]|jgi:aryl-phospho-beta-D-glucosidase BglC (GH1 family)|nr:cellulase family glycosylhydrolase [Prevotellaceae bacterium]